MNRLSVVDEMFLRAHRGMGTPIALQGLWRTADPVDPRLLHGVHETLRTGPLGRRVIRSRIPGARPRWQPTSWAHPLALTNEPIPAAALLDWADAQGDDLDPELGPGWRLSAAPLDDGGCVVALTCSHALADGRALTLAIDHALAGTPLVAPVAPHSDWADARQQWAIVLGGTARALRLGIPARPTAPPPRKSLSHNTIAAASGTAPTPARNTSDTAAPSPTPTGTAASWAAPTGTATSSAAPTGTAAPSPTSTDTAVATRPPSDIATSARIASTSESGVGRRSTAPVTCSAVLQIPAREWMRVAVSHGGTANSLFVHTVANMLWATGFADAAIAASLPVDTRDEPRVDNDLAMTEIKVVRADTPATIRGKARAAYEHRMTSPGGIPEELLQVIPDRWAYRLSKGAGERDILCSNIGTLPDSLLSLGPHPCTGVAARAIHPGLRADALPRTRLSGYLTRIADSYSLSLVSLDPDAIPTSDALRELAVEALTGLGLTPKPW